LKQKIEKHYYKTRFTIKSWGLSHKQNTAVT